MARATSLRSGNAKDANRSAEAPGTRTMSKKKIVNQYPEGWDEARVRRVLEYYENQTEEEAVAEDEAAFEHEDTTMVEVPNDLLPAVRELLAKR